MTISGITTKIFSTLENPKSVLPVILKDGVDSSCVTYQAFKAGGKVEGTDRGIDEFGTQAIWAGGIPFFKKMIDMSAYKLAKVSPSVDIRVITNKEYAAWAVRNATGTINHGKEVVSDVLNKALENPGKSKALYIGKIAAATGLTLFSYFKLTSLRHKKTENSVKKEMSEETLPKTEGKKSLNENDKVSFSGLGQSVAEGILFNPVHNMKIIDAGITTQRLASSRNKTEFCEYAIKEGSFLFFIYGFGALVQKGINKFSKKVLHHPIDLNYNILNSDEFKKAATSGRMAKDLENTFDEKSTLTQILDYVKDNPKNILVQSAKKSNTVATVEGSDAIDVTKYIGTKDLTSLKESMKEFLTAMQNSKETPEIFLKKAKTLKSVSIMANLALSCFVLGYGIPKAVYKYREWKTGSKSFHVANDIKNRSKS